MIGRKMIAVLFVLAAIAPYLIVLLIAKEQGCIEKATDANYVLTFYLLIYASSVGIVGLITGLYYLIISIKESNASNRNH